MVENLPDLYSVTSTDKNSAVNILKHYARIEGKGYFVFHITLNFMWTFLLGKLNWQGNGTTM